MSSHAIVGAFLLFYTRVYGRSCFSSLFCASDYLDEAFLAVCLTLLLKMLNQSENEFLLVSFTFVTFNMHGQSLLDRLSTRSSND